MNATHIIEVLEGAPRLVTAALVVTLYTAPATAQPMLTLSDAIARAHARNPDAASAAAAEHEAAARVTQAHGGYFPKVDVAESWQRGNHPAAEQRGDERGDPPPLRVGTGLRRGLSEHRRGHGG